MHTIVQQENATAVQFLGRKLQCRGENHLSLFVRMAGLHVTKCEYIANHVQEAAE